MFKKISYVLLCVFCISVLWSVPVAAFPVVSPQQGQQAQNVLNVNGTSTKLQQPVLEKEGTVYLPMVETFARLGGRVGWNNATSVVTAAYLDYRIVLKPNSNEAAFDGTAVTLPQPTFIREGRTYVPLSFFEQLGFITAVQQDERNKIRYFYLHTPHYAFKYGQGELYKTTLKEAAADYTYLLNYPEGVTALRFGEEDSIYKELLPLEQGTAVVSETLQGYPQYNAVAGVIYGADKIVLQVEKAEEVPGVAKQYASQKLLGNLSTKNGVYRLCEYKNDLKEIIFTPEGELSGFGEDRTAGLFLAKDTEVLPAAKLGNAPGMLQEYLVADDDYLFIVNAGGYLVEENRLREKIAKPKYLDLQKKGAYLVIGSVRSPAGKYQKIYGEVFNLEQRQVNSTSFIFENREASALEVTQVFLAGQKVIFQVSDGAQKYIGYYDLYTYQQDLQQLPHWVKDVELIHNSEGEFLLCRDGGKLYVQKLDFEVIR